MPLSQITLPQTASKALLAGVGAMACITLLSSLQGLSQPLLWLMAPFGATMVILFALPQSPLARPRSILFGHLLTSATGIAVMTVFGVSPWSLGFAVGLSVALMMLTGTTHPPAGANPIVVMLAGESWSFLINPVLTGALTILLFGWLYHRGISGQTWPASGTSNPKNQSKT